MWRLESAFSQSRGMQLVAQFHVKQLFQRDARGSLVHGWGSMCCHSIEVLLVQSMEENIAIVCIL